MLRLVLACSAVTSFFLTTVSAWATPQFSEQMELVPTSSQRLDTGQGEPQKLALLRGRIDPLTSRPNTKNEKVEHISIVLVGDTGYAPHRATPLPNGVYKYGRWQTFAQTTRKIAPEINGDINFANMETVISGARLKPYPKKYNFITHPNGAKHLVDVGFNLFSMANNHSFDYGAKGVRHSWKHAEELKKSGLLAHAGIGPTRTEAGAAPTFERKNTRFAFAAIGIGAGGGGIQRATAKRPGQLSLNFKSDLALIGNNLRSAKADYRMLSIHRGPERYIRPNGHEVASVRNMVKQGDVDLMIGHHAHVTRGIEEMDGRLIVYGLGNFLHQGTANMNGKSGCQNYSLLVRVHLVRKGNNKPQLAAVEAVPINSTHMQTARLRGKQGARRIGILNGLARQFDNAATNSRGVRFVPQRDGSGLYCKNAAATHPNTRKLCGNYAPTQLASNAQYSRALATCGRASPTQMFSKPEGAVPVLSASLEQPKIKVVKKTVAKVAKTATKAKSGKKIPAWQRTVIAPANETYAQKRARWKRKEYTKEEVAAWKRHVAKKKLRRSKRKKRS